MPSPNTASLLSQAISQLNHQARDVFFSFVSTEESLKDMGDEAAQSIILTLSKITGNVKEYVPTTKPGSLNNAEIGQYYYLLSFLDHKDVKAIEDRVRATGVSSAKDMPHTIYEAIIDENEDVTFKNEDVPMPDIVDFSPEMPSHKDFDDRGKENIRGAQINTLINPDNIPRELMVRKNWANWMALSKRTKDKIVLTKPPVNSQSGKFADLSDSTTFNGYADVVNALWSNPDKYSGVTFMIDATCTGIIGIDIDHCIKVVDGVPFFSVLALNALSAFCDSYCEVSPSGTGIRIFTLGSLPQKESRKTKVRVLDELFPDQVIEWYDYTSPKALTVTGAAFQLSSTPDLVKSPYSLLWLYHTFFFATNEGNYDARDKPKSDNQGERKFDDSQPFSDDDIMAIIGKAKNADKFNTLYNGSKGSFGDDSAADTSFCSMLAFYTQSERGGGRQQIDSIFRKSKRMRAKWDKRHYANGATYGSGVIDFVTKGMRSTYKPRDKR